MKSMPGSDRAMPLHGQVKFVPSIKNWFSLVPEPNADTVLAMPVAPEGGDVGEIPGAALINSHMLERRCGIALMASMPKRLPNPRSRPSMRHPGPRTHTYSD